MDFIVLIDALRHDFIDSDRTPFLYELRNASRTARVIETFAFQTRPAFFAGLEPDQSGICHLYQYNPDRSPFSFLKPFRPMLKRLDPGGAFTPGRGVIKRIARQILRSRNEHAAADVLHPHHIPLWLLDRFSPAETAYTDSPGSLGEHRTLFDDFRDRGLTWNWIGYPRHYGSSQSILRQYTKLPPADVTYLHFSELDWMGHKFGPTAPEIDLKLTEFDSLLRELLTPLLGSGSHIAVFGDHGMVEVSYAIDLLTPLRRLGPRPGTDYVFFLDSTQARFWFHDTKARDTVVSFLETVKGGHILSDSERDTLGVRLRADRFGEVIFALDGPGIIHPSFFDVSTRGPLGMHGYLPSVLDNQTQIFTFPSSSPKDLGTIKMTAMYQLMKDHFVEQRVRNRK